MSDALVHTVVVMGTVVSIQIVGHGGSQRARRARASAMQRAIGWFYRVETVCSRFDASSEVRQLSTHVGTPVVVSPMLFEAVQFAVAVADDTDGAFDPTVGARMEQRGFDRDYRTNARVGAQADVATDVSFRDLTLDATGRTITLRRPLRLDLGAVAKGLAVDMAARELAPLTNFAIDAGGDLYLGGHNADDALWRVGIRHPRDRSLLIDTLTVSDCAVCTSGDYERVVALTTQPAVEHASDAHERGDHHLMDARTGGAVSHTASVTVMAPSAMVADALGTAAFVLGPADGIALLQRHGVQGMIVTPSLERFATERVAAEQVATA